MSEILPIRRKTLSNQSINQSITNVYTIYDIYIDIHVTICVVKHCCYIISLYTIVIMVISEDPLTLTRVAEQWSCQYLFLRLTCRSDAAEIQDQFMRIFLLT